MSIPKGISAMKCNQSRSGFELVSPCSFPTTITITPIVNLLNVEELIICFFYLLAGVFFFFLFTLLFRRHWTTWSNVIESSFLTYNIKCFLSLMMKKEQQKREKMIDQFIYKFIYWI